METLIASTCRKIELWLAQWPKAVVLWSGGKDSTAMLHLIRYRVGAKIPVIQFREPRFRRRYAYSDMLIDAWDLEMHDYAPGRIGIADGLDIETGLPRFDFLKYYQWGKQTALVLSLGTEHPKDGEPYLCAIDDVLCRPTGTFNFPWQAVFHGQKSADIDLIKGAVPLAQDIRFPEDGPVQFFPMRDWTDTDIFTYLEASGVPNDNTRYEKVDGEWGHKRDKSQNADYYPICFNCINRHLGGTVHCPKLQAEVTNISNRVTYTDLVLPEQGFRAAWPANSAIHDR